MSHTDATARKEESYDSPRLLSGRGFHPPRRPILHSLFESLIAAILFAALSGSSGAALAQASAKKPNILVIMGDDVGWFNIGVYHRGVMSGERRRTSTNWPTRA